MGKKTSLACYERQVRHSSDRNTSVRVTVPPAERVLSIGLRNQSLPLFSETIPVLWPPWPEETGMLFTSRLQSPMQWNPRHGQREKRVWRLGWCSSPLFPGYFAWDNFFDTAGESITGVYIFPGVVITVCKEPPFSYSHHFFFTRIPGLERVLVNSWSMPLILQMNCLEANWYLLTEHGTHLV